MTHYLTAFTPAQDASIANKAFKRLERAITKIEKDLAKDNGVSPKAIRAAIIRAESIPTALRFRLRGNRLVLED